MKSRLRLNAKLLEAIAVGDIEEVKQLLLSGAEVHPKLFGENVEKDLVDYPLCLAAEINNLEIVRLLLAAGANPNIFFDLTALSYAADNNNVEMMKLLLSHGANVDLKDCDGDTAVMGAAALGHFDAVRILVENGATINYWSEGDSPLSVAGRNGHRTVFDYLFAKSDKERREHASKNAAIIKTL